MPTQTTFVVTDNTGVSHTVPADYIEVYNDLLSLYTKSTGVDAVLVAAFSHFVSVVKQ